MDLLMHNRKHSIQATSIKYNISKRVLIIKKMKINSRVKTFKLLHFMAPKKIKLANFCKKMSQMILKINNKCKLKIMDWMIALERAIYIKVEESTKIFIKMKN